LIVRLQKRMANRRNERSIPSRPTGKLFTSISWLPARPELQDFQVFTRAK
jgi:hypothetical protein